MGGGPGPQLNGLDQGASGGGGGEASLLGNQVYPFQCSCGKGLAREREIQAHSSCQHFMNKYNNLLQAFVTLKHDACQNANTLQSYQNKMSLYTLLTSFRADIKEHLTREQ